MQNRRTQYALRQFIENTLYMNAVGLMSDADAARQMFLHGVSAERVIELMGGVVVEPACVDVAEPAEVQA